MLSYMVALDVKLHPFGASIPWQPIHAASGQGVTSHMMAGQYDIVSKSSI